MVPPQPAERCPFQSALEFLGKRHTLSILWVLQQDDPRRFNEIKEAAGLNPVTLTDRLGELTDRGILVRREFDEAPPRVEYGFTQKGRDLLVVLDDLETWADRHGESEER